MSERYKNKGKNYRAYSGKTLKENKTMFFPTYHALTRRLLDIEETIFKNCVFLEPCAGAGDITKIIKEYYPDNKILEFDIEPRNGSIIKMDFLDKKNRNNIIADICITNPPFKLFGEFYSAITEVIKKSIYLMVPLDYLHGVDRYENIYSKQLNGFGLKTVYVLVRRPLFGSQYHAAGLMPTGATSFSWLHFEKNHIGDPNIKWININEEMGQPTPADQILMEV